jgi:hypothetical protein
MEKKNRPFTAARWNWADPSGYGVPGKPITRDQFYTEDVFLMLVPDDGLGPTQSRGQPAQSAEPAPRTSAAGRRAVSTAA